MGASFWLGARPAFLRANSAFAWLNLLIITNALWAIVFLAFILLAYLTPDTTYQVQNFEQQTQMQSSGTEVVTQG